MPAVPGPAFGGVARGASVRARRPRTQEAAEAHRNVYEECGGRLVRLGFPAGAALCGNVRAGSPRSRAPPSAGLRGSPACGRDARAPKKRPRLIVTYMKNWESGNVVGHVDCGEDPGGGGGRRLRKQWIRGAAGLRGRVGETGDRGAGARAGGAGQAGRGGKRGRLSTVMHGVSTRRRGCAAGGGGRGWGAIWAACRYVICI